MADTGVKMLNLAAAEDELQQAQKKLEKYQAAFSAAVRDGYSKETELRFSGQELRDIGVKYYLGDGGSEDDLFKLILRRKSLDDFILMAQVAQNRLEREIGQLVEAVQERQSDLADMKDLACQYQKGKQLYPESYARAKDDRDKPLLQSTAGAESVIRLRTLRDRMLYIAGRLGCEDDCQQFLSTIEGEAE